LPLAFLVLLILNHPPTESLIDVGQVNLDNPERHLAVPVQEVHTPVLGMEREPIYRHLFLFGNFRFFFQAAHEIAPGVSVVVVDGFLAFIAPTGFSDLGFS